MVFEQLKQKKYPSDLAFDAIYPKAYQQQSARHFTPVKVAVKAANLLVKGPNAKVLDIGSGVGKFCCIGASISNAQFYGVEKRKTLTNLSNKIKRLYKLKNAHFMNADFTELDFSNFNGIYFFNSFQEQLDETCVLDETSKVSLKEYRQYHEALMKKLEECKSGTRLVTYYTFKNKIPAAYEFISADKTGLLKFYIKK